MNWFQRKLWNVQDYGGPVGPWLWRLIWGRKWRWVTTEIQGFHIEHLERLD